MKIRGGIEARRRAAEKKDGDLLGEISGVGFLVLILDSGSWAAAGGQGQWQWQWQ